MIKRRVADGTAPKMHKKVEIKMNKSVRFGILGCGMIARFHASAIAELSDAVLVGVADAQPDRAKAFAKERGIAAYIDYAEMLADPTIDAVCICTPNGYHAENTLQALDAGKHVVLEKPIAITVEDAERIIDACERTKKQVTVISQLRFSEDVKRVKELVADSAFGKLAFCNLSMKYWRDPAYYTSGGWKGTKQLDGGGALMNQGVHGVDLLLYIVGDATVVSAKTQTVFHNIDVEDTAIALLEFENGCYGTLEASTCSYPGFERKIEIYGSEGCAILRENQLEKLIVHGETQIDRTVVTSGTAADPAAMSCEQHHLQLKNFIGAINGCENLLVDVHEGKRAVKLIQEIYQAK